ncbi:pyruvate:ferredoxin (flavodoxin) oxidoreductase [Niastella koreensis]|uniref:Pyruvate ferredoxin/flavodoxin oxidoreductase n=2 Tax=Niastella koreensis TaxID=354356 RepID=G8TKH4_NIAKG|nr:pyruvate:ferredoxin (flavodoxin) oxidoreductase [Niastella koreensis]AEV97630.1 pyruvate ferredoxin/flavodoxin oxidoreductase [Niastella koreensis GR20-10]OQP40578.1 pyruvate:ferredoxin (flavodoxin) oxidoreductase [Niastella koreensis]
MTQETIPVVATLDGNEAVAYIAYRVNEVCAIYPITPSSTMAELADEWAAAGTKNIWGQVPDVIEMQSEGGAAGVVHGALQAGALTTTFTASQGLMLMLPNMYKIAGELTSAVFHVAARSLAAQALSIFGDHSDVMAARTTGFAMLSAASVQEAHDMALISQAATLQARIPFIHFFDGFRTSHEINKIRLIPDHQISNMINDTLVNEHRLRSLNPDRPFIRGTAQNPDVYFQGRETVNPFYAAAPGIVENAMDKLGQLTGRCYRLFEYYGHEDAERIAVVMGSGGEVLKETVRVLQQAGEKVGVIQVRLFRPFSAAHLLAALPATVEKIVVLDRTKEPGAGGEPLYQDIVTHLCQAFTEGRLAKLPRIIGGRYGLSSKEFTPAMAKAVLDELKKPAPMHGFTIGIHDDISHTSLSYDPSFRIEPADRVCALFYGLGADGTVGANKNSIKIIGEETSLYAQGYFVYDSRKSGTQTVSHLRFGKDPVHAPWLIDQADFIACHKYNFISKTDMLQYARPGATFLLNSPYAAAEVWDRLPRYVQEQLIEKQVKLYVINASQVAAAAGLGQRINTIMQTCFFALSGVLPAAESIEQIKKFIRKSYEAKGEAIVLQNFRAVDESLAHLVQISLPVTAAGTLCMEAGISTAAPAFVQEVTAMLLAGKGDLLPVSKLPADGTYPSGTTKWEKRNIADTVPVWEPDSCIQCGNCSFVCPHSVIRSKFYHESYLNQAPDNFPSADINARGFPETRYTLQVYLEDCTGCNLCVQACPAIDIKDATRKAINMSPKPALAPAREYIRFFENLPVNNRAAIDFSSVRGAQFLEPLFEFSGACAGCGETPYIKLLTQLFGDRLLVANATGCSSIYGGNLPTTPWSVNKDNRGPAWSNSLFEDNAEFGLGMRVAADKQLAIAQSLLYALKPVLNDDALVDMLLHAPQQLESQIAEQRSRVTVLKEKLQVLYRDPLAAQLLAVADHLVKRSVWLIGGDGWAYDIGSAGLDHVLSTGRNVNILVLDTEVYSNTGGQMSKATPTAATAKFAAAGKKVGKKDLAMQAISYGNVYVAQIAMGANPQQTLLAMREAEAYKGPSLILAYSHCIAHGIEMEKGLTQQQLAVASGYWPLIRYNPALREAGKNPFVLDSPQPTIPFAEYANNETRYKSLATSHATEAARLMQLAQELVMLRWKTYENMATWKAEAFAPVG